MWDFRFNANFPFSKKQYIGNKVGVGSTYFLEHLLVQDYTQYHEDALTVLEVEAARRLGERNLWAFLGTYYLDGGGEKTLGGEGGIRGCLAKDILASLSVSNDKLFDTTVMFNFTWFLDGNRWGGRTQMAPSA